MQMGVGCELSDANRHFVTDLFFVFTATRSPGEGRHNYNAQLCFGFLS